MSRWLPVPASSHAAEVDGVMTLVHLLMLALFVGWGVYFAWVLVRFRRARQPAAADCRATGRATLCVEAGVVVAEGVLLVVFALPIWFRLMSAGPPPADAIVVRVVAEQFVWTMHYPGADGQFGRTSPERITAANPLGLDRQSPFGADDIVLPNELHVPVGRPVAIQLSSKDVIHSFGVPAMRVKLDATPGLIAPVWFTPTVEGEFEIACSQLCGIGHHRMRGVVIVHSEEGFLKWVAEEAARLR